MNQNNVPQKSVEMHKYTVPVVSSVNNDTMSIAGSDTVTEQEVQLMLIGESVGKEAEPRDAKDFDECWQLLAGQEAVRFREIFGLYDHHSQDHGRFFVRKAELESGQIGVIWYSYYADGGSFYRIYPRDPRYASAFEPDFSFWIRCGCSVDEYIRGYRGDEYTITRCEGEELMKRKLDHEKQCNILAVVEGRSRKTKGFTQTQVARLFDRKFFGFTSSSGNYESITPEASSGKTGAVILHYSTIESIWTNRGVQIENSQCWASGFAKCESHREDFRLPLTTIRSSALGDIYEIEVLDFDREHDNAVFRIGKRYFLVDRDENNRFVAELAEPAATIMDAYRTMEPQVVRDAKEFGLEVKRQGEYFFVKTGLKDKEVRFRTQAMFVTVPKYIETDNVGSVKMWDPIEELGGKHFADLSEQERLDFIKRIKEEGIVTEEKYVPQIEKGSRHVVQFKGVHPLDDSTVVKGYVKHIARDHRKLDLGEVWHIVAKNVIVQSYTVTGRGTGGRD